MFVIIELPGTADQNQKILFWLVNIHKLKAALFLE
jgi:hypothetical protein